MSRAARFKQADLTRAIRAVQAAGLSPSGVKVGPNGEIEILVGGNSSGPRNSFDELLGKAA